MAIGWMLISVGSCTSLLAWLVLAFFRGRFWLPGPWLEPPSEEPVAYSRGDPLSWPPVRVIVPARNEASVLRTTVSALRSQQYPGELTVTVVDDQSTDGTHDLLASLARIPPTRGCPPDDGRASGVVPLRVLTGRPLPAGWAGKVWAMQQGWEEVTAHRDSAGAVDSFVLFTDADVRLAPGVVKHLVRKAVSENRDLVSVMAHLRVDSFWDRLLIPAFVYFFAKLYPFRRVASPVARTSAAAGGCVLVREQALNKVGGPRAIASALIDDCALARQVARTCGDGRLWLGMSRACSVESIRRYGRLPDLWSMVARSAYHQLRNSPILLAATVAGMLLIYGVPPACVVLAIVGAIRGSLGPIVAWLPGTVAWVLMTGTYMPILRIYGVSSSFSLLLPLGAALYTAMTVSSAFRTWAGRGGAWKGRIYAG